MFTGIVEEVGTLLGKQTTGEGGSLSVEARTVLSDLKIGDSVAVNGACLTVTQKSDAGFTADVMGETLRRTNLGLLKLGSRVNLERAMPADGRFGGHIVSGHIDGTGRITARNRERDAVWITVAAGPEVLRYIVEKGSVAIDGISLTVADTGKDSFRVSVIPHTQSVTTLLDKKPGAVVNLECDVIAKYVERFTTAPKQEGITLDFLRNSGF